MLTLKMVLSVASKYLPDRLLVKGSITILSWTAGLGKRILNSIQNRKNSTWPNENINFVIHF